MLQNTQKTGKYYSYKETNRNISKINLFVRDFKYKKLFHISRILRESVFACQLLTEYFAICLMLNTCEYDWNAASACPATRKMTCKAHRDKCSKAVCHAGRRGQDHSKAEVIEPSIACLSVCSLSCEGSAGTE